ncbi:hypothetical protein EYF80_002727 [Liparis tanakae]|uniref:Uncharacterized protein n=1 Tax=Liparis tanakae TaxID=230148 RepID=A0A4Z2JCE0_9TELE|nr:hypothetical protein EYF80_002727 [Liparis tanakae]
MTEGFGTGQPVSAGPPLIPAAAHCNANRCHLQAAVSGAKHDAFSRLTSRAHGQSTEQRESEDDVAADSPRTGFLYIPARGVLAVCRPTGRHAQMLLHQHMRQASSGDPQCMTSGGCESMRPPRVGDGRK